MKQIGGVFALVFAVTLAVVVGKEMSGEAMAVVIGVVCGVAAGIPTALLLLVAFTRRDRQRAEEVERQAFHDQRRNPPVIVIQGGSSQALPSGPQAGYWPGTPPGPAVQRQFHVVGGDDLLLEDRDY
jgi:hypothetical protein